MLRGRGVSIPHVLHESLLRVRHRCIEMIRYLNESAIHSKVLVWALEVFLDVKFPPGVGRAVVIACCFVGRALVLFFSYDVVNSRLPWEDLVGIFDFVLLAEVLGEQALELLKCKCVGDGVGSLFWSFGDRLEDFNCCCRGDVGPLMESLVGLLLHHFIGHGRPTALPSGLGRSSSLHRERLSTSSMLANVH